MPDDWRWQNLQTQPALKGLPLRRVRYSTYSSEWDHDHCSGCWAKFMELDPPEGTVLHEGYTTSSDHPRGADYWWVCPTCFDDFKDAMEWTEVVGDDDDYSILGIGKAISVT